MGPRSPKLMPNGSMPPPPYQMRDNPNTWLDQTDLVFIDPVGTGYSRAKTVEMARRMNSVQGDLQSVGEFIRMYITRNDRTLSPLFIAGESYGTFRAAGLAGYLIDRGHRVQRRDPDLGDAEPGDDLVAVGRPGLCAGTADLCGRRLVPQEGRGGPAEEGPARVPEGGRGLRRWASTRPR